MTYPVMGNRPLRQVLSCISEEGRSEIDIATLFSQKYPPDIELFVKLLEKARAKAFREQKQKPRIPNIKWQLDRLVEYGYIEHQVKRFHLGKLLDKETVFYHLSPLGRSVLHAATKKR